VSEPGILSEGDHDGATIASSQLRALRQQSPSEQDAPTALLPVTPGSTGLIRVSTGQVVTLDRTVIIGRRPRSTRASGANLPHLIAVDSPQQDISRSHLEIRPEGDTVVVIDLHTTNGSTLLRPGADPIRLHPGEQTLVLSGDVVDLGDDVKVAFEDLP
jgi:pSer/pThr/pTyr-binding forkhead associated (FHA) protein